MRIKYENFDHPLQLAAWVVLMLLLCLTFALNIIILCITIPVSCILHLLNMSFEFLKNLIVEYAEQDIDWN